MKLKIGKKDLFRFFRIVVGAAVYAVGVSLFLKPTGLITGGATGIAMMLNYLIKTPVGVMVVVLNIPLFILAAKEMGKGFLIGSGLGTLFASIALDTAEKVFQSFTGDMLLGAIYGGVITGAGIGLVFTAGASMGGTDIAAGLLRKRFPYMKIGVFVFAVDLAVIASYAVVFKSYDAAMYSLIAIFISSKVLDTVLYGLDYSKAAFIISDNYREITAGIMHELNRGVTELSGRGGYSGNEKTVLFCAIKRRQIVKLKEIVKSRDPKAFVIIADTREVLGEGFAGFETEQFGG